MKNLSRGLAILLCICMVLGMLPATVLAADDTSAKTHTLTSTDEIVYDALFMSDLHNGVGGYPGFKQMISELKNEGLNPRVISHGGDYVEDDKGGTPNWQTEVYDVISGTEKAAFPDASLAFTMGNHDWESGTFGGNSDKEAAFKSVFGYDRTGLAYADDELEIYMIGAQGTTGSGGGGETFIQADIDAFDQYLDSVKGSGKVIFLQTHWPAHSSYNFKQRVVTNSDKLIDVLNKYGDQMDLVWVWGHNHYEDEMRYVILQPGDEIMYKADTSGSSWGNPRNPQYKTIKFTYANAGCMNDMWYLHDGHNDTSASTSFRGPSACLSVAVTEGTINFQYNRIQQVNNEWVYSHDATLRIYNHNVTKEHPAEVTVARLSTSHTHDYQAAGTVAPTCTADGYTIYTCSICGKTRNDDVVAALGHSYVEGICTVCGAKDPNYHAPVEGGFTIDFTKEADADKYAIDFATSAAVTEGEGLKMSSTTANFEAAGDAFAPTDVIKVPVSGNFIATVKFNAVPGSTWSFGSDSDILGFYAMEDYQNGVGLRAGNSSIANFTRKNGTVVTGNDEVGAPVGAGFTTNATNWFRIEKNGEDYYCSVSTDGENFTEVFCFADTGLDAQYLVLDAYKTTSWSFGGNNAYTFQYMDVVDGGPDKIKPAIASISVNGKDIGFDKSVKNYNFEVAKSSTKAPTITVVPANAETTVEVSKMDGAFGTAYVTATANGRSVTYTVSCNYGPEDDYFADGDMNDNWTILHEVAEPTEERPWTYHRMEEGTGLVLPTQKGSIYMAKQADPQGPWTNVFTMPAQGDWEIITKSFYPQLPKDIYQQTQVFAWQDEDHYIRINCQYNAQQNLRVEPAVEIGSGTFNILEVTYANPNPDNTATLYYKVNKTGTTYTVPYSTDCKTWVNGGSVENLNYIDPKFGLFCTQDDGNDNYIELSFEYVAVTSRNGEVIKTEEEVLQWAAQNAADYMAAGLPAKAEEALSVKAPHGYEVEFVSSNPDVIAADGTVTPAKNNAKVQVAVKVTEGDVTATSKSVTISVPGTDPEEVGYVLADKIEPGKTYVIVANNALAVTNAITAKAVTVADGKITSEVTEDMLWNFKDVTEVFADSPAASNGSAQFFIFAATKDTDNFLQRGTGSGGESTAAIVQVAAFPGTARWARWSFEPRADGSYTMYANTERDHSSDYAFTFNVSESAINCTNSYGPWDDLTASGSSIRLYELAGGEVIHEHKYNAVVTAPTCTEAGFTTYTCECGNTYVADEIPALGHDFKETTVAATCTKAGSVTVTCSRCDYKKVTEIPALGHDLKETIVEATCTKVGSVTVTCSRCDYKKVTEIPALGHDFKETTVEATCTKVGSVTVTCSRCDYKKVTEIPALGHDLKETTVAATCTKAGSVTVTCSRCDYEKVTEIPAFGHDYVNGICQRCGNTEVVSDFFDDVLPATFCFDAVKWAVDHKVTNGVADGIFAPSDTVTRGQIVTFLWRAAGCPEPTSTASVFTDVKKNAFYAKAVAWASELGITNGVGKNKFDPESVCTRDQIVTFLWRYMGKPTASAPAAFIDIEAGAYYANAVAWAVEMDITTGITPKLFKPENECTRGQAVTFLYRAELTKA